MLWHTQQQADAQGQPAPFGFPTWEPRVSAATDAAEQANPPGEDGMKERELVSPWERECPGMDSGECPRMDSGGMSRDAQAGSSESRLPSRGSAWNRMSVKNPLKLQAQRKEL